MATPLHGSASLHDICDEVAQRRIRALGEISETIDVIRDDEKIGKSNDELFADLRFLASYVRYHDCRLRMLRHTAINRIAAATPTMDLETIVHARTGIPLKQHLSDMYREFKAVSDQHWTSDVRRDEDWVRQAWDLWCTAGIRDDTNSDAEPTESLGTAVARLTIAIDKVTSVQRMLFNLFIMGDRLGFTEKEYSRENLHVMKSTLLDTLEELALDMWEKYTDDPQADCDHEGVDLREVAVAIHDIHTFECRARDSERQRLEQCERNEGS